jgi:hypothetical protein
MPEIHPHKIKLRGKVWTLCTHPMVDSDGLCEKEPWAPKKHIWIDPTWPGEYMLELLLHEMLHCCYPDLEEDAIATTAKSIAKVLWDLGYRAEWDEVLE